MATSPSNGPLVWIDCEMTGLDSDSETILSISCFITDAELNHLDVQHGSSGTSTTPCGWDATIHHEKEALDSMNQWCIDTHGKSGLTAAAIASTTTAQEAADDLLSYIKKTVPEKGQAMLAGNSVHCDKEFLRKTPYGRVLEHLHYRILDVSSLKEAARRWAPKETLERVPKKKGLHQAREDILESIEEARFYKDAFFRQST